MDVEFVLRMQSNSPHCNESRPPIDENFTRSCVNSEARLPPIAANNVTPDDGYIPCTTNDVWLSSYTTRATIKASTASATNSSINTTSTLTSSKKLSTSILDDDMLSLDISDEENDSFIDDAMEQDDDVLGASCDNFNYKSYPSKGENSDIDTKVQHQEAILITSMQKSAESRAAVQRLGILSTERLNDARKILQSMELPSLASATHLLSRNEVSSSSWYNYNKDDTMRYDSIVAAARLVLDNS